MKTVVINAGHTKTGVGTGANGFLRESIETRKIAYELLKMLADDQNIIAIPAIYDTSQNNLYEAVQASNKANADLFVSIHLNAGKGTGSEIYTWKGNKYQEGVSLCNNFESLGFKNRGIKDGSNLYVIKKTKCKALLIEVCFVDNKHDQELFQRVGYTNIAKAIYNAIK